MAYFPVLLFSAARGGKAAAALFCVSGLIFAVADNIKISVFSGGVTATRAGEYAIMYLDSMGAHQASTWVTKQ